MQTRVARGHSLPPAGKRQCNYTTKCERQPSPHSSTDTHRAAGGEHGQRGGVGAVVDQALQALNQLKALLHDRQVSARQRVCVDGWSGGGSMKRGISKVRGQSTGVPVVPANRVRDRALLHAAASHASDCAHQTRSQTPGGAARPPAQRGGPGMLLLPQQQKVTRSGGLAPSGKLPSCGQANMLCVVSRTASMHTTCSAAAPQTHTLTLLAQPRDQTHHLASGVDAGA